MGETRWFADKSLLLAGTYDDANQPNSCCLAARYMSWPNSMLVAGVHDCLIPILYCALWPREMRNERRANTETLRWDGCLVLRCMSIHARHPILPSSEDRAGRLDGSHEEAAATDSRPLALRNDRLKENPNEAIHKRTSA